MRVCLWISSTLLRKGWLIEAKSSMTTYSKAMRVWQVHALKLYTHSVQGHRGRKKAIPNDSIIRFSRASCLFSTFLPSYRWNNLSLSISKLTCSPLFVKICPSTDKPSTTILMQWLQGLRENDNHWDDPQYFCFLSLRKILAYWKMI